MIELTAKHWLVTCSCGWERETVSEWAARSVSKLHPQLAPMDVTHVTRVEGLDERGGVTGRRDGDVLGQVWSRGIGLFCLTTSAGAATYRVTIVGVEWVARPEAP